ncbi:MAG: NlpC/P60 family protein [Mediterraneibacter faecis]
MKLKKVSSMILAVTLACTMTVTPVLADEVSDLKQKKQETQNQVSDLQTQLNSLMTKISDLENDLIETGEEISQTEEDLKTAQEEQEQQYAAMKLRIKYMYEEGTGTATVEKVLTSGDISSVLTQAEYSQQVHSYDRDKLEEYVATVQKVEDLKTTLETKMADLQETQTEYDAQKDELNTTITEKSSEIANLDVKIDEAVKKAAEEEAKRKAAEAAAKKAAEEAAKKASEEAAKKNNSSSSSSNRNNSSNSSSSSSNSSSSNSSSSSSGSSSSSSSNSSSNSSSSSSRPSYSANKGSIIVNAAYSQIGVPYVWGGTTPGVELDCSGLVQYCYRQAGISIPRTSGDILAQGTIVNDPQPGDICWTPGHVAIYIGGGQMIEAQQTGVPVKISSVRVTYYVRY